MPVWLAHDEVLGKEVSLHFVPAAILGDPRGLAELRQEVKRNRQLIHPNILRVYDFVEDDGLVAISMDRFEGESLATLLRGKGKFTAAEIHIWIQQLAGTLDDAHRVSLFHRDLSPSNIFVKPAGGIFITNFGVSRCIRDAMERTRSLAEDALHLAYMSPQLLDGEKPTRADDVYGLGVLCFELLSGHAPFSGGDIVPAIRTVVAPKLAEVTETTIPTSWESMIAACLEKRPELRPATCSTAAALLAPISDPSAGATARGGADAVEKKSEPVAAVSPASGSAPVSSGGAERRVKFGSSEPFTLPAETKPSLPEQPAAPAPEQAIPSPQIPPAPPEATKVRPQSPKSNLPANFPELNRPRSKWPIIGVGLAAGIVAFGVVQKFKHPKPGTPISAVMEIPPGGDGSVEPLPIVGTGEDIKPSTQGTNEAPPPLPKRGNEPSVEVALNTKTPDATKEPSPIVADVLFGTSASSTDIKPPVATPKVPKRIGIIGAGAPPVAPPKPLEEVVKPTRPVEKPAPEILIGSSIQLPALPELPAKLPIPPPADSAALEKLLSERLSAEASLRHTSGTAEQAQQEVAKLAEVAKKSNETLRKTLEERRKTLSPALKENEALIADRKKREDEMIKAEAFALEARKAADAAKATLETLVQQSGPKLEAVKKAEDELKLISLQLVDQLKQSDELSKSQTQVTALRQQVGLSLLQIEKEKTLISAAMEKAKASAMEAVRAQNLGKITDLQKRAQIIDAEIKKSEGILTQLKDLGDAGIAASKPIAERIASLQVQAKLMRDEIIKLGGSGIAIPPLPVAPTQPAPPTQPVKSAEATSNGPNSLGMKFVQIGDIDFAVNLVTRKDYEVFATDKGLRAGSWRSPGFAQGPDHPVINITWKEADAFCKWLTDRERASGQLKATELYRLPGDLEWSRAVGLPPEKGAVPEDRDLSSEPGIDGVFPWGLDWPPTAGAGNYAGEETDSEVKLQGYRDEYQWTSPVGKFKPNAFGLYDMGGNVWQWTGDFINNAKEKRVLRGGSWYNGGVKPSLLSSCRIAAKPDDMNDTYGFRVVRVRDGAKTAAKPK